MAICPYPDHGIFAQNDASQIRANYEDSTGLYYRGSEELK